MNGERLAKGCSVIWENNTRHKSRTFPTVLGISLGMAYLLGLIGVVYPVLRATRLEPLGVVL